MISAHPQSVIEEEQDQPRKIFDTDKTLKRRHLRPGMQPQAVASNAVGRLAWQEGT
jgi:hypothetical protein